MPTERKVMQVAELRALIEQADVAIAANYQGISSAEQAQLRQDLSAAGAQFKVVKNTLLRRAAMESGHEQFADLLDGPTALVLSSGDPVAAAKAVVQYTRDHRDTRFQFRSAVVEGRVVDADYVRDLATVPPREELIARIAGGLTGKLVEFMGLMQATVRDFSGLVDARATQLESGATN